MSEWIDYANESRLVNGIGEIVATIKHLGDYYNHPPIYVFDNRQFQTLESAKRIAEGTVAMTTSQNRGCPWCGAKREAKP